MKVPLTWLAEYVDLPAGTTPEQVHAALVRVGFEEEEIHRSGVTGPLVVGRVLEFTEEPQSNGKTIRWCMVRVAAEGQPAADGGQDVRGIVCGAHNFEVGDAVVVALPGSVLPGDFAIAARKTYGHVSDGMLASAKELGLGDDHAGIIRLHTLGLGDAEVGADARALLGLNDSAVEVNVTPDRGYALSIRGIAREYSHSTGATFRDPAVAVEITPESGFEVAVDDHRPIRGRPGVRAFVTRVVRNIDPKRPTPPWLAARLRLAGIRSVSLPVDITNYVMLELGNPVHGYDLDRLNSGITVRRAEAGEKLTTLDGAERLLDTEDLLITDGSGPIGLAGVMGGASTELNDESVNVLVEAANFDPVSVARTARRHKLPSEASKRFERGVDPEIAAAAAARTVQLLVELAGGTADALGSSYAKVLPLPEILLPADYPASLIGLRYTTEEIEGALREIGATVLREGEGKDTAYRVTPPSWRPDLTGKAELVEEIARLVGYDRIPVELPVAPPGRGLSREQKLRRSVGRMLAAAGHTEVAAYPFVADGVNARFGSLASVATEADRQAPPQVTLSNPLDGAAPHLRVSLLPGLVQLAHRNISRGLTDLALFETGLVFRPEPGIRYGHEVLPPGAAHPGDEVLAEINRAIPPQPRHLGVLLLGDLAPKQPGRAALPADWHDALESVRLAARAVGAELVVSQGQHPALHPGRTAMLSIQDAAGVQHLIGYAGELLPALAEEHHLPRQVAVAELDLDRLIELAPTEILAVPVSAFPAATQDLSLVLPADVPAGTVLATVQEGAGPLLEEIRLVDDYRGTGVSPGTKSLTFALRFRDEGRTLTSAEASAAKLAGVACAVELLGAEFREE